MLNKFRILFLLLGLLAHAQNQGPWNSPLRMAWSIDGISFGPSSIFQDSSGVPSLIRWKGDTLITAFQWFRQPNPSPSWDRVAVKFSYDKGITWTEPVPIVIPDLPAQHQRPFDPTLVKLGGDSIRIYFSSSVGMPMPGGDSIINTYSAVSIDGIHYSFEPGARVDVSDKKVIDPAVIRFNNLWHFTAPIGAPQDGAYHFISNDGLNFNRVSDIGSDNQHNWTGNLMVENGTEIRFYGAGSSLWYNRSSDAGVWQGYTPLNLQGGDPSVLKIEDSNYLIVFVGPPYAISTHPDFQAQDFSVYPNPVNQKLTLGFESFKPGYTWHLYNSQGQQVMVQEICSAKAVVEVSELSRGLYIWVLQNDKLILSTGKLVLEN